MEAIDLVNIELAVLIGTLIVAYISALVYGIVTLEDDDSSKQQKTGGSNNGTSSS